MHGLTDTAGAPLAQVFARMGPGWPGGGMVRDHWFWPWGGILLWALVLGLLAVIAVMLLRRRDAAGGGAATVAPGGTSAAPSAGSPLDVAKMRYARGEITKEEYEVLKADLE